MKAWQSFYVRRLLERSGRAILCLGFRRMIRAAAIQTAIQPWGILILPIAFMVMLPFLRHSPSFRMPA